MEEHVYASTCSLRTSLEKREVLQSRRYYIVRAHTPIRVLAHAHVIIRICAQFIIIKSRAALKPTTLRRDAAPSTSRDADLSFSFA